MPDGAKEVLPGERCPRCQGTRTHRSRIRGPAESFLRSFTPLRPFACSSCSWRGWRIPDSSVGPEVPLPPLPVDRKFHRSSGWTKKQEFIFKVIKQVVLTAVIALIVGNLFTRCQRDAAAAEVSVSPK